MKKNKRADDSYSAEFEAAEQTDSRRKTKKKGSRLPLILLLGVIVIIFLVSAYKLGSMLYDYAIARKQYNDLSNKYATITTDTASTSGVISAGSTTPAAENQVPEIYIAPPEGELTVTYSEVSPISVDFHSLCATCSDVIGWIYSPDTIINYPVAIGRDNVEYLHKAIDGSYIYAGTIFADYACQPNFSDENTILYGHNMNDGSMFAKITSYKYQEYYEAHPVMYLNTPSQNYRIDIFSAYTTPDTSDTYTYRFSTTESYQSYLDKMVSQSDIEAHITPDTAHRIVTLSTCAYDYENARYVVQGMLVPIG